MDLRSRVAALEAAVITFAFDENEPRDERGRWTSGGGSGTVHVDPTKLVVAGTEDHPIHVASATEAAELIQQGHYVELPPDQVSVLMDRLHEVAQDAKAKGENAPTYDLCKISVADTNLFCAETKGIERIDMPQLSTKNPVPGSPADALPRNDRGEVSIVDAFKDRLKADGHNFEDISVPAAQIKATQNQLDGVKIAGMMASIEKGTLPPGRVFVSSDNYALDGHHRWAAQVGEDYNDQHLGDVNMDVTRVDVPISVLLGYTKSFAAEMGVPQAGVAASAALASRLDAVEAAILAFAVTEFGDKPGHEFHGNQYTYKVEYAEDHEAMAKGEYKSTTVTVQAKNETEANLTAAQMAGRHGIPTSTKLLSTRLDARLADHSGPAVGQESVQPGDKIVDASKLGREEDDFSYLHGATIKSSEQGYGGGITRYTDRNGYEGKAILRGGVVTVDRPARG